MNSTTVTNWIQILTALAVLFGLGLVIYELQQTRNLAKADLMIQQFALGNDVDNTMLGENPMDSLVRDCMGETITPKDALILHEYFDAYFDKGYSYMATIRLADPDVDSITYAKNTLRRIFSLSKRAQIWWEIARNDLEQEGESDLVAIGDELLSELGPPECSEKVRKYLGSNP